MRTCRCPTASTKALGDKTKAGNRGRPSGGCVGLRTTGNGGAGFDALDEIAYHLDFSWLELSHEGHPSETRARTAGRTGPRQRTNTFPAGCAGDTAEWTTGPNSSIPHAKGLASSEYGMSRKPLHLSYDERPLRKGMRPNGPKSAKSTVGGERQPLKGRDEAREMDTNQQLHWLRTPAQLPAS